MKQLEIISEPKIIYNDNDGSVVIKASGETKTLQRIAYDYNEDRDDVFIPFRRPVEFFNPSAKMKSAYHLCRFCGGKGCLGCQKERERDNKRSEDK